MRWSRGSSDSRSKQPQSQPETVTMASAGSRRRYSRRPAMPSTAQNYVNHRRTFPLFHFFAYPIVALNVLIAVVQAAQQPTLREAWYLLFSIGVAAGFAASRASTLMVQDRL